MIEVTLSWIKENQILSGAGTVALAGVGWLLRKILWGDTNGGSLEVEKSTDLKGKAEFKVLFIDDQVFKVVDILKKQGWTNTKRIRDVKSFDEPEVVEADVFFVDIQGVGKQMLFRDEGLGLAIALKDKFSDKKVVIYSAENRGDRFHDALKKADDYLSKNADPYEFEQIVQNFFDKQR